MITQIRCPDHFSYEAILEHAARRWTRTRNSYFFRIMPPWHGEFVMDVCDKYFPDLGDRL